MAVSSKKYLKLTFDTDNSKSLSLNIDNVKDQVKDADINSAMDAIVTSGIILYKAGKPVVKKSAELIETTSKDFSIA